MTIVTIKGLFPHRLVWGYRSYQVSQDGFISRYVFDSEDWADCVDIISLQESYGVSDNDIEVHHYNSLED